MIVNSYNLFTCLLGVLVATVFVHFIYRREKETLAARFAGYLVGMGFVISVILFFIPVKEPVLKPYLWLHLSFLSHVLCTLILLVSFIIHRFSLRYMAGDRLYQRYFFTLAVTTNCLVLWVLADNLFFLCALWTLANVCLVKLMTHKKEWAAARYSGKLTLKTLMPSALCLFIGMMLLYYVYQTASLQSLQNVYQTHLSISNLALALIVIAACVQSAIWPFHRWLISSLNSPTPVSALMHAGFVNGGGILMVKFAPLFSQHAVLLMVIFLLGAVTALLGSVWKLIQFDIKRMLACSTMAQMGFMMMQCGLGLFAAAITHLCWHGLFKAYLFLTSGSAFSQKKVPTHGQKPLLQTLPTALMAGILSMMAFAYITDKPIISQAPSTFLLAFAFIAGAQIMITLQQNIHRYSHLVLLLPIPMITGVFYGASVALIEAVLPDLSQYQLSQLNIIHWLILTVFLSGWFVLSFGLVKRLKETSLGCKYYMMMLNQSQPHPKTVTTIRNTYQF